MLSAGYRVMQRLFPGIEQDFLGVGAILIDATNDAFWFQNGGYLAPSASDLNGVCLSRPQLEAVVRSRVLRLPNVTINAGVTVLGLTRAENRSVGGVTLDRGEGAETLTADLVVDASGRGSRTPAWLAQLGYRPPAVSEVKVNMAYATRTYRRSPGDLDGGHLLLVAPQAPHQKRGAVLAAQEGNRWMVTLTGMLGDHPPVDDAGLLAFARSLPTQDIYDIIAHAEPLSDIVPYRYPSSLRHHYERLSAFPEGVVVIGDAICSFNPIFGQGMTVASLEAQALQDSLEGGLQELWKRFFRRAAKRIDIAWTLAASADLAFPETLGTRGPAVKPINAYIARLLQVARHDPGLTVAFHQVSNLIKPPSSLFSPNILWRVGSGSIRGVSPHLNREPCVPLAAAGASRDVSL
nr:monooxygenase [Deinococcus ruber]